MNLTQLVPTWLATACFAALLPTANINAQITINEIRIDQPGTDTDEFIELFSEAGGSLNGLSLVVLQDNGSIDEAIDLSAISIAAGDVFLIAEATPLLTSGAEPDLVENLNFENGENAQYLIVDGLTGSVGDDLDTDDDGVFDGPLPWTSIVDGVALIDDELTVLDPDPGSETGFGTEDINYAEALGIDVVGPDGPFFPGYVFASADGAGIDTIGAFDPAEDGSTPGTLIGGGGGTPVVNGDFDGDGDVDCNDINEFVGNLDSVPAGDTAALDLNNDNMINLVDVEEHIETLVVANGIAGTILGDVDCNGLVDVLGDAFVLVGSLGSTGTVYTDGDLDFNGTVDVLGDAFILVGNLGMTNAQ